METMNASGEEWQTTKGVAFRGIGPRISSPRNGGVLITEPKGRRVSVTDALTG